MADPGTVSVIAVDKTTASNPGVGSKFVFLGASMNATDLLTISSDAQLVPTFGYCPLTEWTGPSVRASGFQYAMGLVGTAGTITAVTQAGDGPVITVVALTGGPADKFKGAIRITQGGLTNSGVGRFQYALDGYTFSGDIDLPTETAATVVGTVDLVAGFPVLTTQTAALVTEDAAAVAGVLSSPANPAALVTQLQAIITADLSGAVVDLQEGRYLRIKSGDTGALSSLDIQAGTLWSLVGIDPTAAIATGKAATFDIPGANKRVTFPDGAYVLDTLYEWTSTAPKLSGTAILNAIKTLRDRDERFAGIIVCQDSWSDLSELLGIVINCTAEVRSWEIGEPYQDPIVYFGSNPTFTDQATRTAFKETFTRSGSLAVGPILIRGTGMTVGMLERSALVYQAMLMCSRDESISIGDRDLGSSPEVKMTRPDGTRVRDEFTATTKMQDRFNVLIRYDNQPYFMTGRSLASPIDEPGFNELYALRPFLHAMRVLQKALARKLESTPALDKNGYLRESDAAEIDAGSNAGLQSEIMNPQPGRPRASYVKATYNRANKIADTKALSSRLVFQPLAIAHSGDVAAEMVATVTAE